MPASRPQPLGPVVILIAPPPQEQDKQLLQEALKFNAFSVLNEPVDVNVAPAGRGAHRDAVLCRPLADVR